MFHQFKKKKKKIHTVTVEGLKHIFTSTSHGEKTDSKFYTTSENGITKHLNRIFVSVLALACL